MVRLTR